MNSNTKIKKVRTALLFFTVLSLGCLGHTAPTKANPKVCGSAGTDLPFLEKRKIKITDYNEKTATYEAIAEDFPDEGTSYVTLPSLLTNIKDLRDDEKSILKNPQQIVGETYVNEKKVPTLTKEEADARAGCGKPSK